MAKKDEVVEEVQEEAVEVEVKEEEVLDDAQEKVLSIEEAKAILSRHEQEHLQEFANKLQALMLEYNVALSSTFKLFGQVIDPPIVAVPRKQERPSG